MIWYHCGGNCKFISSRYLFLHIFYLIFDVKKCAISYEKIITRNRMAGSYRIIPYKYTEVWHLKVFYTVQFVPYWTVPGHFLELEIFLQNSRFKRHSRYSYRQKLPRKNREMKVKNIRIFSSSSIRHGEEIVMDRWKIMADSLPVKCVWGATSKWFVFRNLSGFYRRRICARTYAQCFKIQNLAWLFSWW